MNRRSFLASAAGALAGRTAWSAAARPNVLVILADDLGWNDVGYHGSVISTPNIDKLASQGTRFEQAYSFPLCSPTRSGLMTGRSPMRLGTGYTVIRPWSDYGIPVSERFMPQAFRAAGYQTSMAGKWHLGHAYKKFLPRARGFDRAYGHLNGAIDYYTHERDGGLDWNRDGESLREEGYTTFLLGDETVRRIEQRDKSKPFFHYLAFNSPHTPLQAPPEYLAKYAKITNEKRRTYCAMVEAMDATIGKIMAALDRQGIGDNTIVLFFSDNGGPVGAGADNTPLRGAKASVWEGGIRVPMIMRWPGKLKAGAVSRQVITMMDYFPTLAGAAGIETGAAAPLDGRNLWPAIQAGRAEPRKDDIFFSVEAGKGMEYAVRRGSWKLVVEGSGKKSLFDVEKDPNETADVAAQQQKLVADLSAAVDSYKKWAAPGTQRHSDASKPGFKSPPKWAEAARES